MASAGARAYAEHVRPLLARYLGAAGLDVEYHRGRGDRLFYHPDGDPDRDEVEVLDLVGGFGASLFGHGHPALVARFGELLARGQPMHVQGSVRAATGRLGARLAERAMRATGRRFLVTFANTGTEAVEAAIKHAEMERRARVDGILRSLSERGHEIRRGLRDGTARLSESLFRDAARRFGLARIDSVDELSFRLYRLAADGLERAPDFVAIEGAFHGKTSGSVKLTHRAEYQAPWRGIGPKSAFVAAGDVAGFEAVIDRARVGYLDLEIDAGGVVRLVEREHVNVAACFVEPIQGEGGVREIPHDFVRFLREVADRDGFPLVFDEIQSGMGRTGRFFATEHSGVRGDYYLLSKALGGSLVKISALLVDGERYQDEFGFVHTSTFADDDPSSEIALAALDLLEADDDALMARCAEIGDYFQAALTALMARHPRQIREVRGRGLLLGVELASQTSSTSPMLRVLAEQELLGFVVSGYLLHEAGIRVAPTLSSRATIRLEPSAYIERADIDRFCAALGTLCELLELGDGHGLMRFLVGRAGQARDVAPEPHVARVRPEVAPGAARVAFLAHFLDPADLSEWDPTLRPFTAADCERFFDRTRGVLAPFLAGRTHLRSPQGSAVDCTVIGMPFTPEQVITALRAGTGDWATDLVHQGVELARQLGCTVVGFGGYTSIVTNGCRSVTASDIALTSGNSLTAAAALDSAYLAARRVGLERRVLGVVGAVGNIGRAFAEAAIDDVDEIVLVGRPRGRRRLEKAASSVYAALLETLRTAVEPSGVARSLAATGLAARVDDIAELEAAGDALRLLCDRELGDAAPVRIADDMSALRGCTMILSATNSARPVIFAEHVGDGPVVISDVAVPMDVDPGLVRERPQAVVLRGGMVKAPLDQIVEVEGMHLEPGEIYGCLGETLLMGLAGVGESLSYGALEPAKIRRVRELARMHGFRVEENLARVDPPDKEYS